MPRRPKAKPAAPALTEPQQVALLVSIATSGCASDEVVKAIVEHSIASSLVERTIEGLQDAAQILQRALAVTSPDLADDDD